MLGIHMPTENQASAKMTTSVVMIAEDQKGLDMTEIDEDHALVAVALIGVSQVDTIAEIVVTAAIAMTAVTEGVRDMLVRAMNLMIMKGVAEKMMNADDILVIDIQTARGINPVADLETEALEDDQDPEIMIVGATKNIASTIRK
jgi:hypothetical protein